MNIRGKHVTLRAVEESDLELLQTMMNDPHISNVVLGYKYPVSSAQQKNGLKIILAVMILCS